MLRFRGKGVYGAYAAGKVSLFVRHGTEVQRTEVEDPQAELKRLEEGKDKAVEQLHDIYSKTVSELGEANAEIFEIHSMMIEDDDFNDAIKEIILTQSVNAEYAVLTAGEDLSEMFAEMDDEYMRARSSDIKDISQRLISCISGNDSDDEFESDEKVIIVADDLTPSETAMLDKDKILAFVTAGGSATSHTAILAGNLEIPAVIGVGEELLEAVKDGDMMTVDGYTGDVMLSPDEKQIEAVKQKRREDKKRKKRLSELVGQENVTLDGRSIKIYANIQEPRELDDALAHDAGGIGLFRSEFLYLDRKDYPTEEQQLEVYTRVLRKMEGKNVIIRTLDIGADKQIGYFELDNEDNPALGFRAIRLCLTRPDMFKVQLRALYRASVYGDLSVMFPMITSTREVKKALRLCKEVREELKEEGIPFREDMKIGIMIETPAAAVISDLLAPMVDFFSIGTNDLTQYTLACDRQNGKLEDFVDPHHEAVMRLIEMTVKNAHEHGIWVGICGELGSDPELTERFIRMGIDELSVSVSHILPLREKVRSIDLSE